MTNAHTNHLLRRYTIVSDTVGNLGTFGAYGLRNAMDCMARSLGYTGERAMAAEFDLGIADFRSTFTITISN